MRGPGKERDVRDLAVCPRGGADRSEAPGGRGVCWVPHNSQGPDTVNWSAELSQQMENPFLNPSRNRHPMLLKGRISSQGLKPRFRELPQAPGPPLSRPRAGSGALRGFSPGAAARCPRPRHPAPAGGAVCSLQPARLWRGRTQEAGDPQPA